MTNCGECTRLERVKEEARAEGDYSKVTDCNVLLKKHPDHPSSAPPESPQRPEAPKPRKART
ncbi:hypothetical protein J7E99_34315 [Streptomyces sp. ISL-44]|uniref:hypothetical protein n=1 Tax=Streptomyces sp. ISL-44 TaxID=2819184 RepID=UPI001BE64887|nr:hypothetical protein [Streptomyces sp. ISL-44]MBT2545627.1 hypothetical protein [Streptomyces sp. ISL-44]